MAELLTWFKTPQELYYWGAIRQPISIEKLSQDLRASHLNSCSLVEGQHDLHAFGLHYLRLNRHHLGRLVVKPEHRGKGLAKTLVTKLIDKAFDEQGAKKVSLFVFRDNLTAYRCYQSLGFLEHKYPGGIPDNLQNCAYMILPNQEYV
jgi:ribosomal protein S18 acetylase RimI-like enzyme